MLSQLQWLAQHPSCPRIMISPAAPPYSLPHRSPSLTRSPERRHALNAIQFLQVPGPTPLRRERTTSLSCRPG